MALERWSQRIPRLGVPQPDDLVARCRRQRLAIRREGYGPDPGPMARERRRLKRDVSLKEKLYHWLIIGSDREMEWARSPSLQLFLW